jgi:hypothetical protein
MIEEDDMLYLKHLKELRQKQRYQCELLIYYNIVMILNQTQI